MNINFDKEENKMINITFIITLISIEFEIQLQTSIKLATNLQNTLKIALTYGIVLICLKK